MLLPRGFDMSSGKDKILTDVNFAVHSTVGSRIFYFQNAKKFTKSLLTII